ncbi:hypothetical protein B0H17DRAFT_1128146 [Mycena rosella]|uniref:Uncharacterized protein n=1 Tax=Mycena rosella TaxID=1033263 RepID=A0AAD7E0B0_MYCRO|nr:hypothetical protein B0H17DRAFT_1128146 [Mycena rosella]
MITNSSSEYLFEVPQIQTHLVASWKVQLEGSAGGELGNSPRPVFLKRWLPPEHSRWGRCGNTLAVFFPSPRRSKERAVGQKIRPKARQGTEGREDERCDTMGGVTIRNAPDLRITPGGLGYRDS